MKQFYYLQTKQSDSVNTIIRKGKYTKKNDYKKIPEGVKTMSLYVEDIFKKIDDLELIEDKESKYVTYSVIRKMGSKKSELGKITIKSTGYKNRMTGFYSCIYFYNSSVKDKVPIIYYDCFPLHPNINEQSLSRFKTFLIEFPKGVE